MAHVNEIEDKPMIHRMLALMLFLSLETGCPDNWRKGGAMDKAIEKDREDEWRTRRQQMKCQMPKEKWMELCVGSNDQTASGKCPDECASNN